VGRSSRSDGDPQLMRVLVVIPTCGDRPEMLAEALESVWGQTRPPDVVSIRERYVDGVDIAIADRVNAAIEESGCDAFLILSDDDKLDPMFIEKTVQTMEETGVDIVYTDCHIFGLNNCTGAALGNWTKENIDRNTVPLITSLCRTSAWLRAGKYFQTWFFDWDFWWRCFYTGATAYWLRQPLFWWRDHASGATRTENLTKSRQMALARFDQLRSVMA
jgi:hypothetical protein